MSDQHAQDPDQQSGWGAVPPVDSIRGTRRNVRCRSPRIPRDARDRCRIVLAGSSAVVSSSASSPGGTAVVLLLVAGVVGYSVGSASHSADRPVRAFLDDLTAGRVADALDDAGIDPRRSPTCCSTEAAYAKAIGQGHRLPRRRDARQTGDTATVRAYLRQGGQDVAATFTLDKTGTDWGVFPMLGAAGPRARLGRRRRPGAVRRSGHRRRQQVKTAKDGTVEPPRAARDLRRRVRRRQVDHGQRADGERQRVRAVDLDARCR